MLYEHQSKEVDVNDVNDFDGRMSSNTFIGIFKDKK